MYNFLLTWVYSLKGSILIWQSEHVLAEIKEIYTLMIVIYHACLSSLDWTLTSLTAKVNNDKGGGTKEIADEEFVAESHFSQSSKMTAV